MTEYQIPEFLRRKPDEKRKELSRFVKLLDIYEGKFNCAPPTEPSLFTEDEWCTILEECIRENKTFQELTGFKYEKDFYY